MVPHHFLKGEKGMSVENNILGAIDAIVGRRIDSTPIDLTVTATVARIHNAAIGEYKVTYQSNTFSAYSLDPLTVYRQGEEVYVLVPRGDFSTQKMILGKAAFNDRVSFADRQAMQNQWRKIGPNWLSHEWYWKGNNGEFRSTDSPRDNFGIIACTETQEENIRNTGTNLPAWRRYLFQRPDILPTPQEEEGTGPGEYTAIRWARTRHNGPVNYNAAGIAAMSRADRDLQIRGRNLEYIMISADFQTQFMDTHTSGEYGVMVECYVNNPCYDHANDQEFEGYPNEPKYLITSFRLTFADFHGTRYSFPSPFPQQAVFSVPAGVIKGLVRVSVFQTNGWRTDVAPAAGANSPTFTVPPATYVYDIDNIIASDIQIHWCEPINLDDRLFWIDVQALRGTSLFNSETASSTSHIPQIPLRAKLMYGSQDITDEQKCKFVWFRQKFSALRSVAVEDEPDE
jgi:hypothetical protein